MVKVEKSYHGLYDLLLRDQFILVCNKDLASFLKERIPKTIDEMLTSADQFKEARQVYNVSLVSSCKNKTQFEQKNARAVTAATSNETEIMILIIIQ